MESSVTKKIAGRSGVSVLLLLALTASTIHNSANAWVSPASLATKPSSSWRATPFFMSTDEDTTATGSKDDGLEKSEEEIARLEQELKIAKLEAELAKLKDEKAEEVKVEEDEDTIPLEEASMDMFMSEGWKEARSGYDPKNTATMTRKTEEQDNAFGLITKVVGGLLAVILFSQIPLGQEDLSKYSAIKSAEPKTSIDLGDINRVKGQQINYNDEDDS